VYSSIRDGKGGLYQRLANNSGTEERLVESDTMTIPVSWSPDGNLILYEVFDPRTGSPDLWVVPLSDDRPSAGSGRPEPVEGRKPSALLRTPFAESHGQISPDGKWLAYYSNETGASEIYVQPFPGGAGKWQISTNGGLFPRWRRDGRELFYMSQNSGGKMMAVDVKSSGSMFDAGTPRELFDSPYVALSHNTAAGVSIFHTFAVSADGQRFLIPHSPSGDNASLARPIAVVENWAAGLRK
jgi:Tol biopolymer transport system component